MTMKISVTHVHAGVAVLGHERTLKSGSISFTAPALDLDALVTHRGVPGPAFDLPVGEVISFLEATGEALRADKAGYLQEALESLSQISPLSRRMLDNCYERLSEAFARPLLEFQLSQQLPIGALDGWLAVQPPGLPTSFARAFPARIVQILAGNTPNVAATSITRSALTKGVHLLKLPSNDPLTAPAILQTMADLAPGHPVVASFSAAYWRGGDRAVEDVLFRAQYFDKLIAWGGESAIRNALSYAAPGFEIMTFDPKVSISLIGREAFASSSILRDVAALGATDVSVINQDACSSAVFQFVEGSIDEVDAYCELLAAELAVDRPWSDGLAAPTPENLRESIRGLMGIEELYRVFGDFDGHGLVIRSSDPVEFHPTGKVVNVVQVNELTEALNWVTVATQTVGMYPAQRKASLRDRLATRGAQRIVELGGAWNLPPGLSHDGFLPLQHMVRWVNDQG
jgi:hypothetical protein